MSSAPRVSVIVPTYNRSGLVCQSVDSILTQSFTDLEVLIVDDGSKDDTAQVVRDRYGDDPRVRYLHKTNGGAASAQNHGFRNARGELLAINGDDDLWLPDKLELQVALLDANPEAALCFSDCRFMGGPDDGKSFFDVNRFNRQILMSDLMRQVFIPAASVLMRREAMDRIGMFDEALTVAEDWDLWIRFAAAAPMTFVDKPLYLYRQHDGPQLCDDPLTMVRSKIMVLEKNEELILQALQREGEDLPAAYRAMRRNLQRERSNHTSARYQERLRSEDSTRGELLQLMSEAIGNSPWRVKHYRRYTTLWLFGARFTRWWYCKRPGGTWTQAAVNRKPRSAQNDDGTAQSAATDDGAFARFETSAGENPSPPGPRP